KGIGKSIASALAAEEAIPVIVGRKQADNALVQAEIEANGGKAFCVEAELTRPADCKRAIAQTLEQFGRIDGLINNAGVNDGVGLENGNYEKFIDSLHKTLVHYYLMAHYALPALKASKGTIVNITSKTAETGQGNTSGYAASNGARNALTREWAVELLKYGIRVHAIVVAECWTPLYEKWINSLPDAEGTVKSIEKHIPLGQRLTTAEEIASRAAVRISKRSRHTPGHSSHVDGGYVPLYRALTSVT